MRRKLSFHRTKLKVQQENQKDTAGSLVRYRYIPYIMVMIIMIIMIMINIIIKIKINIIFIVLMFCWLCYYICT